MSALRARTARVVAALALLVAAGCDAPRDDASAATADAATPARRVVTLSPDLAELVYTAGAADTLVGTIEYSDFPPEAAELPRVGDAFGLDYERLGKLAPDLVLVWDGGTPIPWIERLHDLGYRTEALGARKLEDVATELETIGRLTGHVETARAAARDYLERLAALRARYAGATPVRVFYEISAQPLYTVGGPHAITAMIELCGGRNVFDDLSALAADVSHESVLGRDPEVILAGDDAGPEALEEWRRWPALTAVAQDNLYAVPAELVTRSSTRLIQGAEHICAALQRAREKAAQPDASRSSASQRANFSASSASISSARRRSARIRSASPR